MYAGAMKEQAIDGEALLELSAAGVGGRAKVDLFDEERGRWLALPHPMAQPRGATQLVSLPASALQAAAVGAGH